MPPPGHVGSSLISSLSRGSCEELNPRLIPRPGSPSWIRPSPCVPGVRRGLFFFPPRRSSAASTAVFIDALSRAGMCNRREGGALELRGKQVKIAWRAHTRRSACSGRLEPWRRCGAHHNELTTTSSLRTLARGLRPHPAGNKKSAVWGPETRENFFFFFFGGGPGEAVLCCPRSSHMAAGTATCRWAKGLQKCGLDSELFLETTSAGGRSQRGGRGVPYRRALCLALHSFLNVLSPVGDREGPRTRWLCPNSRRHSSSWTPRCSLPEHFLFRNRQDVCCF